MRGLLARAVRLVRLAGISSTLMVASAAAVRAHEIPADVTAHVFLKPEGTRMRILVRVPLGAMRDVDFPLVDGSYLDVAAADAQLRDAAILWVADELRLFEDGRPLPQAEVIVARASLPSDRSFGAYGSALAHVTGPALSPATRVVWSQALLDILMDVPISSEASDFSVRPGLERLGVRVATVLHFVPPGGPERVLELSGDPGVVRLDPRWHQAALSFVALGFRHILGGLDHLLFLLCLILPFRRVRPLVWVVTAFTVAHSVTLVASAYGLAPDALWFPPLVETLIAASIVYMALENVLGAALHRRWAIAFAFGLVHGFGFSFALHETLQFAGRHLVVSLLSFNVGVELGQLLVLAVLVPALNALFRRAVAEKVGTVVVSVVVAHTAWHWMAERFRNVRAFELGWRDVTAAVMGSGLRWLLGALILATLAWVVAGRARTPRADRKVAVAAEE